MSKLIFLDIDGTLTTPGSNTPPQSAIDAIKQAQQNGHKVFLSTGRNLGMLAPLLTYDFDGVIACGGGLIMVGDHIIYDCPMDNQVRDLAMDVLQKNGIFRTIEAKDVTYGDENLGEFLQSSTEWNSEIERWRKALSSELGILPMSEYDGRPIYKIVIMCQEASQLDEARSLLEKDFNFVIQNVSAHSCFNGDLVNRQFDKGKGVLKVCEYLNVDIKDTIGFGDSMNDLEMIQQVAIGVVMDNGHPDMKAMADVIAPSVEQDGLAKAFKQLQLI